VRERRLCTVQGAAGAAEAFYSADHHPFAGIETATRAVNLQALVTQKDELVTGMRKKDAPLLCNAIGVSRAVVLLPAVVSPPTGSTFA
jgi:hypothetical protein